MNATINSVQDFATSLRSKSKPPTDLVVDPFFEEDPTAAKVLEFAIKRRENILLYGPTGCGKSGMAINVMARLKEQAEVFSCSGETNTDELIAKPWVITEGGQSVTIIAYGAALRAYKDGKGLLIEEVDFAVPDVHAALHRILETNSPNYVCNVGVQEVISRNKNFFVIATANTIGTGEDTFLYAGTKILNEAFKNRFTYTVKMGYIKADLELKVLQNKTGVQKAVAEKMIQVANDIRDQADPTRVGGVAGAQTVACALSTRDLLAWAKIVVGLTMDPKEAALYAFLHRTNAADRDIIKTAIDNLFR